MLTAAVQFCSTMSSAAALFLHSNVIARTQPPYNRSMARGWESKSVEGQIEGAQAKPSHLPGGPDPAQLEILRRRETLTLSRTRVMRELETSQNARYRQILSNALEDLNLKLAQLNKKPS